MPYVINTNEMRDAADLIREVAEHFEKTRKGLARVSSDIPDKLTGGYGQTGEYQGRLHSFERTFSEIFDDFLKDEQKFVAFLEGLEERIRRAAGIYDRNEASNTQSYNRIATALDETNS